MNTEVFGIHDENLMPICPTVVTFKVPLQAPSYVHENILCNDQYFIEHGSPAVKSFKIPERGGLKAHTFSPTFRNHMPLAPPIPVWGRSASIKVDSV